MSPEFLINKFPELDPNGRALIERAYYKAEHEHKDQRRKSGEPYFIHCFEVATILADMRLDAETIAAALMHDMVEDTDIEIEDVEREFGPTIAKMVDGVTKMAKVPMNVDKDGWGNKPHNNRYLFVLTQFI